MFFLSFMCLELLDQRCVCVFFTFFYFDLFLFSISLLTAFNRMLFFQIYMHIVYVYMHQFSHDIVSRSFYFLFFGSANEWFYSTEHTHTHRWSISKFNFFFIFSPTLVLLHISKMMLFARLRCAIKFYKLHESEDKMQMEIPMCKLLYI